MRIIRHTNLAFLMVFLSFGLALPSFAALSKETEGLIDIEYPYAKEAKVEVNLEGEMFSTLAKSMAQNNSEASDFLANLVAVKVRIYETSALGGKSLEDVMSYYQSQLPKTKWNLIVKVKEKNSNVGVYSFPKGEYIVGLVVLVGEPKEFIAVNVAGKIDPAKLTKIPQIYSQMQGLPKMQELAKMTSKDTGKEPNFVIKGVVKDAKTGKPIAGAKVSDGEYGPEPRKATNADSEGKYSYKTWYEEHFVVVEAPGYQTQKHLLTTKIVGKEEEAIINFELMPKK